MHRVVRPDTLLGLRHQIEAAAQDEQDGDDDRSGQKETIFQQRRDTGEQEERESRCEDEDQFDEIERLLLAHQSANDFFVWKLSDIKKRPGFDIDGCTTKIPGIFDSALAKLSKHCEKLLNMHKGTLA